MELQEHLQLAFDNSTTTGIFRQDANVIGISFNGTEKFRIGEQLDLMLLRIQVDQH